jgi:hypothetical protein
MKLPWLYFAAFAIFLISIGQLHADDKANLSRMVSDPLEQKQVFDAQSGREWLLATPALRPILSS